MACRISARRFFYGHFRRQGSGAVHGSQGERARRCRASPTTITPGHPEQGRLRDFFFGTIPGNEKAVGSIIQRLINQGIEVITDRTHLCSCIRPSTAG